MYETLKNSANYVLLLDDDAVLETECALRSLKFADYTKRATIVGGHMFNLYEPTRLHSFAEKIDKKNFFWVLSIIYAPTLILEQFHIVLLTC